MSTYFSNNYLYPYIRERNREDGERFSDPSGADRDALYFNNLLEGKEHVPQHEQIMMQAEPLPPRPNTGECEHVDAPPSGSARDSETIVTEQESSFVPVNWTYNEDELPLPDPSVSDEDQWDETESETDNDIGSEEKKRKKKQATKNTTQDSVATNIPNPITSFSQQDSYQDDHKNAWTPTTRLEKAQKRQSKVPQPSGRSTDGKSRHPVAGNFKASKQNVATETTRSSLRAQKATEITRSSLRAQKATEIARSSLSVQKKSQQAENAKKQITRERREENIEEKDKTKMQLVPPHMLPSKNHHQLLEQKASISIAAHSPKKKSAEPQILPERSLLQDLSKIVERLRMAGENGKSILLQLRADRLQGTTIELASTPNGGVLIQIDTTSQASLSVIQSNLSMLRSFFFENLRFRPLELKVKYSGTASSKEDRTDSLSEEEKPVEVMAASQLA